MQNGFEKCIVLRRPLVGVALAVVSGMVVAATGLFSFGQLAIAALGCILLAGLFLCIGEFHKCGVVPFSGGGTLSSASTDSEDAVPPAVKHFESSGILVLCCVALVSACRFVIAASPLSGAEINRLQPQLPLENVQLVGRVAGPPEYHAYRSGDSGTWVVPFDCEGLQCGGSVLECAGSTALLKATSREANLSMRNTTGSNGMCSISPTTEQPATSNRRSAPSPSTINQNRPEASRAGSSTPWQKYRGRIQVRVTGAQPGEPFRQGGRIRFSGTLRKRNFPGGDPMELVVPASLVQCQACFAGCRPRPSNSSSSSSCFPRRRDENEDDIHSTRPFKADTVQGWETLSDPPRFSPIIWGQQLREAAAQTLSNGIENRPGQLAVYKALLLGYRKAVPHEIHQRFKRTGTLHIFAISGLHVGIVGLLITVVLKSIGIPRDRWGLLLLPLLLGYVVATGMKSSALRALAMAAVYFLSPLFRRKPDIPVSIAFSAILLLFSKPLEILSGGFIFSFTVVSFIVMVFARVPEGFIFRGAGWVRAVRAYGVSLGITSMAALIASVPVTALFFGSFAPVSLVGNLIVVPLTFCIVLSGWLSILVPAASGIFNHAALVFINGLLGTTNLLAGLPGAHLHVPPPPLTALLFWYCGWIHLLVHARTARQRTASFILISLSIVLVLL